MFKKFIKSLSALTLSAALLAGGIQAEAMTKLPGVRYEYTKNITEETVTGRGESLLIECTYGHVINKKGDGRITNGNGKMYISYRPLVKAGVLRKGDSVRTLLFYDIGSDSIDGIFGRVDWRIRNGKTKLIAVNFDEIDEVIK